MPFLLNRLHPFAIGHLHYRLCQSRAAQIDCRRPYQSVSGTESTVVNDFDFIDAVFDELAVDCRYRHGELCNIPARGRVVIVANHPLGGLDGLALLRLVGSIRRDVRVVANELLLNIDPLKGVFLPVDVFGNGTNKAHLWGHY